MVLPGWGTADPGNQLCFLGGVFCFCQSRSSHGPTVKAAMGGWKFVGQDQRKDPSMWEMLLRKLPRNSPNLPSHPVYSVYYMLNPNIQILQLHVHKKHWGKDWAIPLRNNKGGIQSRTTRRSSWLTLEFCPRSFWSFQIGIINFFCFFSSPSIITGK